MNEFEHEFDSEPHEWDAAVLRVATFLQMQGVESALIEVSISSAQMGTDKEILMDAAVGYLLESDNPAQNFAALEYLRLKAESTPDVLRAKSLSVAAYNDSQRHSDPEIVQRKFEVALMNARGSFAQEGMTGAYVMILDEMFERMKASEINDEMYRKAVAEFSAPVMGFAEHNNQNPSISGHVRMALDEILAKITDVMSNAGDQEALRAYSLIDKNNVWKEIMGDQLKDRELYNLLLSGEFDEAAKHPHFFHDHLPRDVWEKAATILLRYPNQNAWGNQMIDLLLTRKTDYFIEVSWIFTNPDGRFGKDAGTVIGLLGRTDIINHVFPDGRKMTGGKETATGIAYGLGWSENDTTFSWFWHKLVDFSMEDRGAVSAAYIEAKKEKAKQEFKED